MFREIKSAGLHDMSSIVTLYDIRLLSFMQEQQALLQDWDYEHINVLRNNQRYNLAFWLSFYCYEFIQMPIISSSFQ